MTKEVIDRRGAIGGMMGCLMSPFIPALRVPKKLEPAKQSFFVTHYDGDHEHETSLSCGGHVKWYRNGSVAAFILCKLFDEDQYRPEGEQYSTNEYWLLNFLWEGHDHETTDII